MKQLLSIIFFISTSLASKPLIIGHRGASGYEPENTLRSFKRALEQKADMIELDVYTCATGEVVVLHDHTLNRTTNGRGNVKQVPWNKIKTYDAGKGEHIPLLEEVFDLVNRRIPINIEIKDPMAVQPVAELIKQYVRNKKWSYDHFIVSSFNHQAIIDFKRLCPQVKTGAIFDLKKNVLDYVTITKGSLADYLIIDHRMVTNRLVDTAHASGVSVFVYTVNTKARAQHVQRLGVDGIITNYPDILS